MTSFSLLDQNNILDMDTSKLDCPVKLNTNLKTFKLKFTKDVDKKSVENSITEDPSFNGLKCTFNWINERELELKVEGFKGDKAVDYQYTINVSNGLDCEGFKITCNFYFNANKPNTIGYIDIPSKSDNIIKEMSDRSFMTYDNTIVGRYILLDGVYAKWVYDIEKDSLIKNINAVSSVGAFNGSVDEDSYIWYDGNQNSIVQYSPADNNNKTLFKCSFIPDNMNWAVKEIKISPNGKLIAFAVCNCQAGFWGKGSLYILSPDGRVLYKYEAPYYYISIKEHFYPPDMVWLDDSHILLDTQVKPDGSEAGNITCVNINDGSSEIYYKGAMEPVTLPGKDLVMIRKVTDGNEYVLLSGGKQIGSINNKSDEYPQGITIYNAYFMDENSLVYNKGEDIMLYNISSRLQVLLGRGHIFGISQDRTKVYYMTNYQILYYFD